MMLCKGIADSLECLLMVCCFSEYKLFLGFAHILCMAWYDHKILFASVCVQN